MNSQSPNHDQNTDSQIIVQQYRAIMDMVQLNYGRRTSTNRFYLSLGSGLLVFLTYAVDPTMDVEIKQSAAALVAVVGLVLCLVWGIQIRSLRHLIGIQMTLAIELEEQLPFRFLKRQRELQGNPGYSIRYGFVEQLLPFLMCFPFLLILFLAFFRH
ncbi:MAG: hypothetical protein ABJN62_01435 [Halioglobus sp.]